VAADRGRFWVPLTAVALAGTAVRFWWTATHDLIQTGIVVDQRFYHGVANALANGTGYVVPGTHLPTADKPPLYPLLLAAESVIGGESLHAHRLLGPLLGGATIVVLALIGRRLGGDRVALLTALLAAIDVQLWVIDSQILSETLYGLLLALVLLLAYRVWDRPAARDAALLGLTVGLAALTRAEAVIVGLLIGLVLLHRHRRAAVRPVAIAATVALIAIGPWSIRNWITFDQPVFLSQQSSENIAGANCRPAYYGRDTGSWRVDCLRPRAPGESEPDWAGKLKDDGLSFAGDHAGRVPLVLLARVARTWGLYPPRQGFGFTRAGAWRESIVAWVLLGLALAGAIVAVRRRVPIAVLIVPAVTVTITAITQFGLLRYRYSADLAFLVLAAFALDAVVARHLRRRGARIP
jgi:4-amino-4-deoxy-L-arabinose transferase-like glycosyltransferase